MKGEININNKKYFFKLIIEILKIAIIFLKIKKI